MSIKNYFILTIIAKGKQLGTEMSKPPHNLLQSGLLIIKNLKSSN